MTATGADVRKRATFRRALLGVLLGVALALPFRPARAQGVTVGDLRPGARIRVTGPDLAAPIVGRLTALGSDSLTVLPEGAGSPTTISLTEPIEVELSLGHHSQVWPWMWKGIIVGGVAGFVVGTIVANHETVTNNSITHDMAIGTGIGVGAGAAVGGVIGAVLPSERWKSVYLSYRKTAERSGSVELGLRLPL